MDINRLAQEFLMQVLNRTLLLPPEILEYFKKKGGRYNNAPFNTALNGKMFYIEGVTVMVPSWLIVATLPVKPHAANPCAVTVYAAQVPPLVVGVTSADGV